MSAVLAASTPAAAEPRSVRDLDGLQLWIGPTGAATHVAGGWESTWGGGVQLVRVREHTALAVTGAWLGAAHYASRDGGRVWLDAVAGTRRLGGWMVGLSAGPTVELDASRHPRMGGAVALWAFAGITPLVRVGALADTGAFVEIGASLGLPAIRW